MRKEPIIVLGEDDDGHATLILRNLKRAGIPNGALHLRDGQAVLDAFLGTPDSEGPLVLLLDIKMPRVDGITVLETLKRRPETARIPVIMLTTTDDAGEVDRCYRLGAAAYITKPVEYGEFSEAIQRLGAFLKVARLPRAEVAQGSQEGES